MVPQRGSRVHRLPRASSSSPEIPRNPGIPEQSPSPTCFFLSQFQVVDFLYLQLKDSW